MLYVYMYVSMYVYMYMYMEIHFIYLYISIHRYIYICIHIYIYIYTDVFRNYTFSNIVDYCIALHIGFSTVHCQWHPVWVSPGIHSSLQCASMWMGVQPGIISRNWVSYDEPKWPEWRWSLLNKGIYLYRNLEIKTFWGSKLMMPRDLWYFLGYRSRFDLRSSSIEFTSPKWGDWQTCHEGLRAVPACHEIDNT